MKEKNTERQSGTFSVGGREVTGEIIIAPGNTELLLHDRQPISVGRWVNFIQGTLHDLKEATLVDCLVNSTSSQNSQTGASAHGANIHPHFIVGGHIDPKASVISKIRFEIDDGLSLFYDFDAFGTVFDGSKLIDQVVQEKIDSIRQGYPDFDRKIETGPHPIIQYFTGKSQIAMADTALGKITISNDPTTNFFSGPSGATITNHVGIAIEFNPPVAFHDAIDRVFPLLRFLEILVGRPQNIPGIRIEVQSERPQATTFGIHWSNPPRRNPEFDASKPHAGEILIDAVRNPKSFTDVLTNWLARNGTWHDARSRFAGCYSKMYRFDIDRLVAAANMFDILPDDAVPADNPLTPEMEAARNECRTLFKKFPPSSPERESILNALGRLNKPSLKLKIRHRAQMVLNAMKKPFPEFLSVLDEAVRCRNHYVHGSETRIDYSEHPGAASFLTKSLEFVFATSDLIEAGWDMQEWRSRGTVMAHPFAGYCVDYDAQLQGLKKLLPPGESL